MYDIIFMNKTDTQHLLDGTYILPKISNAANTTNAKICTVCIALLFLRCKNIEHFIKLLYTPLAYQCKCVG